MPMQPNLTEAVHLLGIYTAGRFDLWAIAGDAKRTARAHIMGFLLGRNATQKESGITALRAEFYKQALVVGDYPAEREDNFISWAKSIGV